MRFVSSVRVSIGLCIMLPIKAWNDDAGLWGRAKCVEGLVTENAGMLGCTLDGKIGNAVGLGASCIC